MSSKEVRAAEQRLEAAGATVLFTSSVKSSRKGGTRIIFVCDACVSLLNPKKPKKMETTLFYIDLYDVSFESDTVTLKSKSAELSFYTEEADVRKALGETIRRQFGTKAVAKMGADKLTSKAYEFCPRGVLARFMGWALQNGLEVPLKTKQYVTEWISNGLGHVQIDEVSGIEKFLPAFLVAIENAKWISSLCIPRLRELDVYDACSKYLKERTHLCHICCQGPATSRFHDFCLAIEGNKHSYISGITLREAVLDEDKLSDLKAACLTKKVKAVGLIKCIKNSGLRGLMTNFLTSNLVSELAVLTLDGHPGLDFPKLVSMIPNLQVLSVANCDLEISAAFSELGRQRLSLKCINLSGNLCTQVPDVQSVDLPSSLRRVDLDHIDWGDDCLSSVLNDLLERDWENGLSLSLSEIRCSKDEWRKVKTVFSEAKYKTPIVSLSWNNNPLSSQFIRFLRKCKNLTTLYMNSCKKFGEYSSEFAGFVGTSTELKAVYLDSVGPELSEFFQSAKSAAALETIDVRNNSLAEEGLSDLASLIQHNDVVKFVAFDGSKVESVDSITEFIHKVSRAKQAVFVDFPSKDLNKLRARPETIADLKAQFAETAGKEDREWIEPFTIYRLVNDDSFPLWLSPELEQTLNQAVHIARDRSDDLSKKSTMQYSVKQSTRESKRNAYKKPIWKFPLPSVETIDVTGIIEDYQEQFSLKNLSHAVVHERKS